ncbi:MAG: hypothetical protein HGB36_11455 [Chlorobiaceae bacterium]|nr:hypothetical protein [Chlorobiaceae bacterium]
MKRKEKALELFRNHCNCSQAVFTAYRQADVMDEKNAMKLATMFGAGCAGTGSELCGAVNGGLLALSMRYGMGELQSIALKAECYARGRHFMEEFTAILGSCVCEDVIGLNLGTPENLQKAKEMKLFETRCIEAVRTAADILETML